METLQAGSIQSGQILPYEVIDMSLRGDMPLAKAWRLYFDMTLDEVAQKAGLYTSEVSRLEECHNSMSEPLQKLARAMSLNVEQLEDC